MVRHWVNERNIEFGTMSKQEDLNGEKIRKKKLSRYSMEQDKKTRYLREFLNGLSKLESHYCRSQSAVIPRTRLQVQN